MKLNKLKIVVILGFLVLVVVWYAVKRTYFFNELAGLIFSPFWKGSTYSGEKSRSFLENYFFLVNLRKENERLKEENLLLKAQLAQYKERERIYSELEKFYRISSQFNYPKIAARIIYKPLDYFSDIIFIDKGSKDGVMPQMPVLAMAGGEAVVLIGQVVEVYNCWSKVILINHPSFAADVKVIRTGDRGILRGRSESHPFVYYLPGDAQVKEQDEILTSGQDGLFPPGILIGKVVQVSRDPTQSVFKMAEIAPLVDLYRIDLVFVLAKIPEINF
ncbi:rod shape-determining protein MreC [Thermodesulfobacterium sp. TA1]|uniref:rod shape-determining protein MreC n=1 Tax=Thermodesulfobacterium sp. TA1 TaxID=2234087 RepID=UPI0012318D3D|nr:rod shape-determining protein MreC [Thermodesulfobacterium sp. TA1]QER42366.1 rod shape-determining protein MreC [Thermodesulfobacterium sp. TA1]